MTIFISFIDYLIVDRDRPWWDVIEDRLMYFFVVMSKTNTDYCVLIRKCVLRHGDLANDIPVQHST